MPLPTPARLSYEERRKRSVEGTRKYWAAERPARAAARAATRNAAAAQVGELTDREVLLVEAIAYWCEGTKSKPYRRHECVVFVNSDPALILLFLRFAAAGCVPSQFVFRVHIHENADIEAVR
ncbi:MAG: hypothetical protein ACLPQY_33350 [Streptosporangiaceae bacterium]